MSLERRHRVVWHSKLRVRHRVVEIDEKRPVVALLDQRHRFAREEIVRIVVRADLDALPVPIEVIGELPVRVRL
jgi:hypothetical protein